MFENAKFNCGWEIPVDILLFGKKRTITASANAYFSTENVTEEQNEAIKSFLDNSTSILENVEKILISSAGGRDFARSRFVPKMLSIKKNGNYAILFDDKKDIENGLVIVIAPKLSVMTADEYL